MLSANEVRAGYTFLGSPAQPGTVNNARCPVRPDSTYAEVRNEGEDFGVAKMSFPRQTAFDDHSRLGFPSSGEHSEPMPISGRYFKILLNSIGPYLLLSKYHHSGVLI